MSLLRRLITVSGWTLVSRILGLVRDRLFAQAFGASALLDAFMMAFQIPNLLRNLFGEGALSTAFIPRYVQHRERDPAGAERYAGQVLTRLALGLSILCGVAMAVAAALVVWGSPRVALVAQLSLPQLPFMVFICVAAIMAGVLNGRRHFAVPAFAPVVLNLCLISTVWWQGDEEIWLLPYAVLAAGVSQVVLHAWALARTSGGVPPYDRRSSPEVAELRRATGPVVFSSSIYQLNAYLDNVIAYAFLVGAEGAVAILYFGNRLLQFPMALIAHGVGTVAYPELASQAGKGWSATGEGLRAATRLLSFFLLPAAVGLFATAEPLVRAIYQVGRFDEESVQRTVLVTRLLALALVPISLAKLQVRCFHAHRDQRTPMRVGLAMVGLNLALNLAFVALTPLREAGMALATAVSSVAGCAIYAALLRRRGAGAFLPEGLLRPIAAAALMGGVVWGALWAWPQPEGRASGYAALRLGAVVAIGAAVYLPIAGLSWLRRRKPAVPVEPE